MTGLESRENCGQSVCWLSWDDLKGKCLFVAEVKVLVAMTGQISVLRDVGTKIPTFIRNQFTKLHGITCREPFLKLIFYIIMYNIIK